MVMGKPSKPRSIEIDGQRVIASAKDINSHIEFASSKQQRIQDISLANIIFDINILIGTFPAIDLINFVENENAFPLAFGCLI